MNRGLIGMSVCTIAKKKATRRVAFFVNACIDYFLLITVTEPLRMMVLVSESGIP